MVQIHACGSLHVFLYFKCASGSLVSLASSSLPILAQGKGSQLKLIPEVIDSLLKFNLVQESFGSSKIFQLLA